MIRASFYFIVATAFALLFSEAASSTELQAADVSRLENGSPQRVLFVGNSYFYYNDSLHNHVKRIAEEIGPFGVDEYEYKSSTIGGATLAQHSIDRLLEPGRLGIDAAFDLVILGGNSAAALSDEGREQFRETATMLNETIRATGADVALYMTHAHVEPDPRYAPGNIDKIASMYISTGNELGALVIPVGLAFDLAYEKRPDIELHKAFDGSHPSLLGTYLAACVVYQSIYGRSTVGVSYDYFGAVAGDDALFLQKIADETVRKFLERKSP
jgi:hypothetical protein